MNFLNVKPISKTFLLLNVTLAVAYFLTIALFIPLFVAPISNPVLFGLLVAAGLFHLWQVLTYIHSVWPRSRPQQFDATYTPPIGVYITVTGEPADIVEETVIAAKAMDYPIFKVYILNDGFVANKDNWREAEHVAKKHDIGCITRQTPGGAKAGNINNAMRMTDEPFIVIFDADHVPKKHFLRKTMGYFADEKVGYVQSPQYYHNHQQNMVTGGAWEQQELFFGAIMKGKNATDSAFMCGTNMVLRRTALDQAGGMSEKSIAEDFLSSLLVHEKGWKSVYVGEVLAEGLAPEDFLSYYKQQFRWARGSLEIVFKYNPLFRRGLSAAQKVEYLSSSTFYLSGLVVALNASLPLIFFFTGIMPLEISTMALALIFVPYIFTALYTIQLTSNFSYTFRALSFSLSSFPIHVQAVWQILRRKKSGFVVTSKRAVSGSHGHLVATHLVYIGLVVLGVIVTLLREGLSASLLSNFAWALVYIAVFIPFITAAFQRHGNDAISLETDQKVSI